MDQSFERFTGKQQLDTAVHTLEGLLKGISLDNEINQDELETLVGWIEDHKHLKLNHPFNEIIPKIIEITESGKIEQEDQEDIIWLCNKLTTDNEFYDAVTADMQRLQGIIGGIISDGVINKNELEGLRSWMSEHEHLKTLWPYDELESLISDVLEDGIIDDQEHEMLLNFFNEFISYPGHRALDSAVKKENHLISGVCVLCPEITFEGKKFCFTGKTSGASRTDLMKTIKKLNGTYTNNIGKTVDFLIVGGGGNPAWAYSCYGRKVEEAMALRKENAELLKNGINSKMNMQIVHENDFWDAVEDYDLSGPMPLEAETAIKISELGIPLIKIGIAQEIAKYFKDFDDFLNHNDNRLEMVPNLGSVAIENIKNWINKTDEKQKS